MRNLYALKGLHRHHALGGMLGLGGGVLGLFALGMNAASCATNSEDDALSDPVGVIGTNDASADAGADANEAGCADDAEPCVVEPTISCDDVDWCPTKTVQPKGKTLASVWGSGANDVWAVGAFGSAIHWDGTTWTAAPLDTHWSLRAVWSSGPNDVWAVSATNLIFHSTGFANGTAKWTAVSPVAEIAPDVTPPLSGALWGTSASDVWVGGTFLGVQHPDNFFYEQAWHTTGAVGTNGGPGDPDAGGGVGWAPAVQDWNFDTVKAIWGSGPGDIWIVGAKQNRLPFAAHSKGVADGDNGVPSWTEFDVQSISVLNAAWGSSADDVWAVGDLGTIRHFTAETKSWRYVASPTNEHLRGIWGSGPKDIWAVGEHGAVAHYDGTSWTMSTTALPAGDKPNLYGVWGSGPNDIWTVGNGVVMHFSGPKSGAQGANP